MPTDNIINVLTMETGDVARWRSMEGTGQSATSLSLEVDPPHPDYENYVLKCPIADRFTEWKSPFYSNNNIMSVGFWFRHNVATNGITNITQDFMKIRTAEGIDWTFRLQHIGSPSLENRFQIVNASGGTNLIGTNLFAPNVWHHVEFQWAQADSGGLIVFVDGSFLTILTAQDFKAGAGGDFQVVFDAGFEGGTFYFKNVVIMEDVTSFTNLGKTTIRTGRIGKNSTHPDTNLNGATTNLIELSNGVWKDVSDNLVGGVRYDNLGDNGAVVCDSNLNGGVATPAGDPLIHKSATILGAKWMGEFSGGTINNQTELLIGNKTKVGVHLVTIKNTGSQRVHRFGYYENFGVAGNRVPSTEDQILIGLRNQASFGDTITAIELWAAVIYKGDDPSQAPTPTVHIKGGHIKGAKIL